MSRARSEAFRLTALPIVSIAVLALFLFGFKGISAGCSAILGGIVWAIPNLYFAYKVFANSTEKSAKQLMWTFFQAEIFKLVLSAVLFVIVIKFFPVTALIVLLSYILAQLMFWIVTLVYLSLKSR